MSSLIPVVFTHRGPQEYIQIAIDQAKRYGNHVILLGNDENQHFDVEHYNDADYWQGADLFERLYTHMSGNHRTLELYCFQLYFAARNLALEKGWNKIFLIDSDVLLYCNVMKQEPEDYDLAVSICANQWKYRWSACLHNSYWRIATLNNMCNFLLETYHRSELFPRLEDKWAWHQANNVPGGVCDMTLLWFFCHGRRAVNQSMVRNGATWDDNINQAENFLPDEYRMEDGVKEIECWNGLPYGYNIYFEDWVRFNSLHFQGGAKRLMKEYAR